MTQSVRGKFYHNSALSRDQTDYYQRLATIGSWCAFSSWALHRILGLTGFILFMLLMVYF